MAVALSFDGTNRIEGSILGTSLVPFSTVNALDLAGSAQFHVAYAKGQWWSARYLPRAPMWLTRAGAAVMALIGLVLALISVV